MKELIGKKAYGFNFSSERYSGIVYESSMNNYIGKVGTITRGDSESVRIEFEDDYWYYPTDLVKDHLVEPSAAYEIY